MTIPAAPDSVTAVAGDASAAVSWPVVSATPDVASYTVIPYDAAWAPLPSVVVTAPTNSVTVTGLAANVTYTFTVSATNSDGTGPQSRPSNVITPTAATALVPACGTCRYWDKEVGSETQGLCRLSPPVVNMMTEPTVALWPLVKTTDWCGQYVERAS